ncbi:protein phosphatase 2C domain-containing protein [Flavilitoribacter nigricans]|uniref:Stage II sporulation protein E (SpoIIE) n=1 Tax=Flavilitoribacter nigricans (strain ATCC 23147 / DSM 23189 / NBRC 102662 / NCIMB 1420 / SS-2) TaxID=1122177 RepID=A0A2D0NGN6_FLAN2|nr:protein phosphatase 2C domain-containing protein [Flavilitoribacter nigricans]PHN07662.1 stage II sporulation protein E (SpoIIE) [Flavilitoribacter nigricans DSM 23189 = NBRC 102662]
MIKIYKHTQIGLFHKDHCEDYVVHADIGRDRVLLAVLDGCTMGTESFFASALIGKLLRKIARHFFYQESLKGPVLDLETLKKAVLEELHRELQETKNDLQLDKYELLSTIVLGIVDVRAKTGSFIAIGDGAVYTGEKIVVFDQNNAPDYFAYHLQKPFAEWYQAQEQHLQLSDIEDISLTTDGVFTFSNLGEEEFPAFSEKQVVDLLFKDRSDAANDRMLLKKTSRLETQYGLKPTDDLGMIRVILENGTVGGSDG